jgi:hypothetical protein
VARPWRCCSTQARGYRAGAVCRQLPAPLLPRRGGVPRTQPQPDPFADTARPTHGGTASVMTFHHRVEGCSPGRGNTTMLVSEFARFLSRSPCAGGTTMMVAQQDLSRRRSPCTRGTAQGL